MRNFQQKQKEEEEQQQQKYREQEKDFLKVEEPTCSSAFARIPSRKDDNTKDSSSLQIPVISLSTMERPPAADSVYTSDNMTIIDTDVPVSTVDIMCPFRHVHFL